MTDHKLRPCILLALILAVSGNQLWPTYAGGPPENPSKPTRAAAFAAEVAAGVGVGSSSGQSELHARVEQGVLVRLRDGTHLVATLVVPDGASQASKRPAIIIQSPYPSKLEVGFPSGGHDLISSLVRKGYVLAIVNDRGTEWSEGEYHWMKGAAADGADVVRWVTEQPWSDGAVGSMGCSSDGEVNLALAKENPPGLRAIVAMAAATGVGFIPGFADQGGFYTGGVPNLVWARWYRGHGFWRHPKLPELSRLPQAERVALIHAFNPVAYAAASNDLTWVWHLPSDDLLRAVDSPQTEWSELIRLAPNSPAWRNYDFLNAGDRARIPMLLVDSWYDYGFEVYGTAKAYQYLSANSPNQYMIIGAGPHCTMGYETKNTMVGQRAVGDARFDYVGVIVKWFDHWLRNQGRGKLDMPKVQYYPLLSNGWVSAKSWPPPAERIRLYLTSNGHANGIKGDGQLVQYPESGSPDEFVDDPLSPVLTHAGDCCTRDLRHASEDQTDIEKRSDVLVYTSPTLSQILKVAGYLRAVLYFRTSVLDTDLALKVVDVYPDGKAYNLLDTIQRLRYRDGIDHVKLLTPGKIYRIVLRQMVTASWFLPGHRLRIEIAGTNFPKYERNMNTGGANYNESHPVAAHDVVYHDRGHASFLDIPIVH